jgi:GntR family transcriptional regulator
VRLRLDHHSGEPIWKQIVEQVKYHIASSNLASAEKLPSIRALGSELKINPRTVVKAYEELAHLGLIVMRQGQGAFVTDTKHRDSIPAATRQRLLDDLSRRLLAEGTRLGATPDEIVEIVRRAADNLNQK